MNEYLFVYPPECIPVSPYTALPLLSSVLKENGYGSKCLDLNILYYLECILNKDFLLNRFNILKKNINLIKTKKFIYTDNREEYLIKPRLEFFDKFIKNEKNIIRIINYAGKAGEILKSKKDFFNINKYVKAVNTIYRAKDLLFFSYFISSKINTKIGQKLDKIEYFSQNKVLNPYYEFFENKIKSGIFDNYDTVFISQAFHLQSFGVWTLAYLLKKYTNVKVAGGGNYLSRLSDTLLNNEVIYKKYFDYFTLGLGADSVVEYAEFRSAKRKKEDVGGLIYYESNQIKHNEPRTFVKDVRKRPQLDFDGINLKSYLIPEPVIPIQVSKGCPWGKCTFCVFHEGKTLYQITPPEQIAREIKFLNKKYGITKFEFADESLTPEYYFEFANEILKLGLKVHYYGFARFDEGFTPEILNVMYKSGFRIFEWGYENPSKRIMKIFNKGINIDSRKDILQRADKAGIWNHCLTIVSVPFETIEEEIYDTEVYMKNKDIFHSRLIADFRLYKNAPIAKRAENFNMTAIKDDGDLAISFSYKRKDEAEFEANVKRKKLLEKYYKDINITAGRILINPADEYLFLWVVKYGKNKCLNIKLSEKNKKA